MKKINCLVIGCGRISKKHVDVIENHLSDKYNIIAVCDKIKERAKSLGNKINTPFFFDFKKAIIFSKPDLAIILTESGNHSKHVKEVAKHVNNILVEKPMALNINDAKTMIATCNKFGSKLFVVKQNRFNPPIVQLKKALDSGRFKKVFLITTRVRWMRTQQYYNQDRWRGTIKLDGNVIANQASHHIDLLLWLNGDVKSVFAYSKKALARIQAEDTVVAILKFKNQALGTIEATTATRPIDLEGSISVLGEGGTVEISGFAVNEIKTWEFVKELRGDKKIKEMKFDKPPNVYGFGHKAYYQELYKAILNSDAKTIDGNEGIKSIKLLEAINNSLKLKKEIYL